MTRHIAISEELLRQLIRNREINWAGNRVLKIYGTLRCGSGKRMKKENRVFFKSTTEAVGAGFRPCGHCLPAEYRKWKKEDGNHIL
ncbi:MAG TPA: Ada metal-binding domain-containing protein [Chitinophagaceae bacterium]|nr:Ada metal-binding domain-containing protein [Chitinophagaceae bacterium]